jgi:hypothetical protein
MMPAYRRILALATLLLLCAALPAQSKKKLQKAKAREEATIVANLKQHIAVLANDSLEGRRTGTAGERKAVNYLVNYYRTLGLQAGGPGAGYEQPFVIDEGKAPAENCSFELNGRKLKLNDEWFPLAWSGTGTVSSANSIALQEAGEAWWIDLADIMETQAGNPHFMLEQHLISLAKEAASKSATALLLFNDSDKPDSLAFKGKDRTSAAPIPVVYVSRAALTTLHITADSALFPKLQVAFEPKKRNGYNVVARIDNGAPLTVVLGAHLDHLGYGEDHNSRHSGEPAIHNGADDNASGTAALMELARILKNAPYKKNNYLLIHFSGEELGLYGSKYFTDNPTIPLADVAYMINMDMVGRLNDSTRALTVGGVGTSPTWGPLLQTVAASNFILKVDSSGTGPSDHTSFYRKDIPVLFFFTGLHTDYHKPSDDAETINYAGEAKVVGLIRDIVAQADGQGKLAFTKTREQSMGTRGFKVSMGIMPDYTWPGQGVKADGVIDGRPAKKAGLQAGDVILQLGDHLITGVDTYMQALNRFEKGQTTTITFKRGNEVKEEKITF